MIATAASKPYPSLTLKSSYQALQVFATLDVHKLIVRQVEYNDGYCLLDMLLVFFFFILKSTLESEVASNSLTMFQRSMKANSSPIWIFKN